MPLVYALAISAVSYINTYLNEACAKENNPFWSGPDSIRLPASGDTLSLRGLKCVTTNYTG